MSWETFITNKDNPQGSPNLNIFKSEDGSLVKNFIHKKQLNWYVDINIFVLNLKRLHISGSRSGVQTKYYFQGL